MKDLSCCGRNWPLDDRQMLPPTSLHCLSYYCSVSIIQVSGYGCSVRLVNNGFNFMLCQRLPKRHEGSYRASV